jgi:hypothetical protein
MATWNLAAIRDLVRQLTGRYTEEELTTAQLDTDINQYYQFTFPAEVKLERQYTYYEFLTLANQAYYDLPVEYTNLVPPAIIDWQDMLWYQDPAYFYSRNPLQIQQTVPWTGDGVTLVFSTVAQGFPIMPGTLVITDNVEYFQDSNKDWTTANVNITGTAGGTCTVNYDTGAISVTFNTAPANGQNIYLTTGLFNPGRPQAVLMFNNQLQFFPVPDTAYRFQCKAYKIVDPLVNATDRPPLDEWGPTIAYGTARNIVVKFGEMDGYAELTSLYKEQVAYILVRTEQTLLNTRAAPDF